jgi:hypothetical protein
VLSSFKHPNIIRLVGSCTEGVDKLCLLCELGQLGDLRKALLDPATASKMTWQIRIRIAL